MSLRPVLPSDYHRLYLWATSGEVGWRFRFRGATPGPEAFGQLLWANVICQYMVVRASDGDSVGLVSVYGYGDRGRTAYVSALAAPAALGSGLVIDGLILLMAHAFETWDLRKLYLETLDFNVEQFGSGLSRYAIEEARLREHEWHMGCWYDLVTYAVWREVFEGSEVQRLMAAVVAADESA